jgi:hypothetical protein
MTRYLIISFCLASSVLAAEDGDDSVKVNPSSNAKVPITCSIHKVPLVKETRYFQNLQVDYSDVIIQYFFVSAESRKTPHAIFLPHTSEKQTESYNVAREVSYCKECEAEFWKGLSEFEKLPEAQRIKLYEAARERANKKLEQATPRNR